MRAFLAVLILIFSFQSWTKADDIKDYEVEGMSIGDSLLDFYTLENLSNFSSSFYPSSQTYKMMAISDDNFQNYDYIQVEYFTNDQNYIIQSISGSINLSIENCLIKKKEIENELTNVLTETKKIIYEKFAHSEKFPDSYVYETAFKFSNTDKIRLYCIDWSEKTTNEKDYEDHLSVDFSKRDFIDWLNNEAFK